MSFPKTNGFGIKENPLIMTPFVDNNDSEGFSSSSSFLLLEGDFFLLLDGSNFLLL